MRPSDGGGTPDEVGVAMRLVSWLPGLGGRTGGVAPCISAARLVIAVVAPVRSLLRYWEIVRSKCNKELP